MSLPKRSEAYPPSMLLALTRAIDQGELFIPCPGAIKPKALRLQFYGLVGALRAESKPELANAVGFFPSDDPPGLWLRLRDLSGIGQLVASALGEPSGENPSSPASSSSLEDPEDIFDRIMKGKP